MEDVRAGSEVLSACELSLFIKGQEGMALKKNNDFNVFEDFPLRFLIISW